MKITIIHNQSVIDPAATVPDDRFPAVLADLERQYKEAILAEFPSAEIEFVPGDDPFQVYVSIADGSIEYHVQEILEEVYATGTFWAAAN